LDVTRLRLSDIPRALKYILWDRRSQRIISVGEYRQRLNQARSLAHMRLSRSR
jgi:hypothetical protein